ncbi:MAG: TonB-dependent receptor [Nevskiaceae bacterium]|nr:MAG: TonB-dependent receptor [Nevskiaceae bacterium]TAM33989.1 MAG: TonB-dependent receptor [Nevskiaceae bacterium]
MKPIKIYPRRTPYSLGLLALFSCAAQAEHTPVHQLETVTVIATTPSTQNSLQEAREEVARTAGGAGLVDAADLRDQRAGTLADALSQATGVFAQSRFGSQEMRLSIRGSGLARTFHTRGISVLQDGVPLNLADGSGDFQSIDTLAADHIEVFRGANALQFGGSNLGGSVNFVTATGYTAGTEARVEGGSFGYRRAYLQTGAVAGKLDGFASLGYYGSDGCREHSEQREFRFTSNLGLRLDSGIENRTFLTVTRSDSELPGNLTKAQLEADPRQANGGNRDSSLDQRRDTKVLRLANKSVARTSDSALTELAVYAARKDLDHPIFPQLLQENYDYGVSLRLIETAPLFGHANRLVIGFNPQYGYTRGDSYVNLPGTRTRGARTDRYRQEAANLIAYAENQFGLSPDLTLVAGAQAVSARRSNDDQFIATGTLDGSYDRTYRGFSPKIGALYQLAPKTQVYGNVAGSFEPPSFSETTVTLPGATAPADNEAQRAVTYELGSRSQGQVWGWDLSIYHARIRSELLIVQVETTSPGVFTGVTTNADHTIHQGVEAGLRVRPLSWLTLRLNGLYNDFRYDGDAQYGDQRLPGVPQVQMKSELRGDFGKQFVALTTESSGESLVDMQGALKADSYNLFGLKAGGELLPRLGWFLEGRNLADEHYASTTGVIDTVRAGNTAQFLPGEGRSFYAGLEWRP